MMRIRSLIKRCPLLSFFCVTFAISWGGVMVVVGPGGIPGTAEQVETLFPFALLVLLAGPGVAGILLTGLAYGRPGLHELASRLIKWRVGVRWYAIALLGTPLFVIVTLYALARISPMYLPAILTTDERLPLLLTGIGIGLMGGFLEELGWTGFAVPGLRLHHGVLASGLIVGLLWGGWHVLVTIWASGDPSGALSLPLLLPPLLFYVAVLPVYRVLMVWVHDRNGSLLLAMLMHASLTASTLFILQPEAAGKALLLYYVVLAAALWLVVAALSMANGGKLARE